MLAFLLTMALAPDAPPPSRLAPVSAVAPAQNSLTLGVEMASLLNDAESTSRQMVKVFDETMPSVFAANPDLEELEVEYPGIIKSMIEAMRPDIARQVIDGMTVRWDCIADVYAGTLTDPELRKLSAFYSRLTGQWCLTSIGGAREFKT